MKEFHVTKQARDKYQFDEVLFSKNGNVILPISMPPRVRP